MDMSLAALDAWLDAHRVERSDGLEVVKGDAGWSVMATRDHAMGTVLCRVPKTALLSHRTSSLPRLLETVDNAELTPHSVLHLALVVLHEFRLGTDSAFWGYLQSLPQEPVPLPAFWGIESVGGEDGRRALDILRGTEAERDMQLKDAQGLSMDDLEQFYGVLAAKMPPTGQCPEPSPFVDFVHAYSLVCTRAFVIDLWHTIALCPFADLLNHSSTEAHTSLSADDFVCHKCGSLSACEHDVGSTSGVVMRLAHLPDSELERIETEADTVDLWVDRRAVGRGEQVFNSYGDDLGDGRILVEWGFVEDNAAEARVTFGACELGSGAAIWDELVEDSVDRVCDVLRDKLGGGGGLLRPPSLYRPGVYELDAEGALGLGVFAAILFGLADAGQCPLPRLEEALEALARWHDESPVVVETARRIVGLLERRLASLYRADASVDELYGEQEALGRGLQHMALSVMINERRLLESARETWMVL